MRAIAAQLQLPKSTVIERLSGRRKGHGHIAGGKRKARVLTDGKQAGHQVGHFNRNRNRFNQTCKRVTKRVTSSVLCTTDPLCDYLSKLCLCAQFSIEQEDELEDLVMYYARRGFPFTDEKLCQLAFGLASRTQRKGFSPIKKAAGRKWLRGYLKRKPNLQRKNSQNISAARAMGANPYQIEKFFDLLIQWIRKWGLEFLPNNIWNIDESGVTDVPKVQKVIGVTGERAFQMVAADKGETTTVVTYISTGGVVVPPMVIFKGSRIKDKWREAAPSGYTLKATESGYVNAEVFSDYGKEFVLFLRERNLLRPDQKHLVLLDLHKSHLFNMKYMTWMKENNIEVCCFPPNCTHILQPLDDVPFAALKTRYQKELASFNFRFAGTRMTRSQFFRVLVPAFTQAFAPENVRKGFQNTGIYPVNRNAKKLRELGPSAVTDKRK